VFLHIQSPASRGFVLTPTITTIWSLVGKTECQWAEANTRSQWKEKVEIPRKI
jgi:hypothetical protein